LGKTLYFDCFSGVSGDMIVGALLDLGLPLDDLRAALGSLAVDLGEISTTRVAAFTPRNTRMRIRTIIRPATRTAMATATATTTCTRMRTTTIR
jgi:uncharacterized protein (DUF111 family)